VYAVELCGPKGEPLGLFFVGFLNGSDGNVAKWDLWGQPFESRVAAVIVACQIRGCMGSTKRSRGHRAAFRVGEGATWVPYARFRVRVTVIPAQSAMDDTGGPEDWQTFAGQEEFLSREGGL
jgi:hypothetical protein